VAISQQTSSEPVVLVNRRRQRLFPLLLALACGSEFFYLLLIALSPLPQLHLSGSPLAGQWPWTLQPFHWLMALIGPFVASSSRSSLLPFMLLGITLSALIGAYACAIVAVMHAQNKAEETRRYLPFLLVSAVIFGLTLLFQPLLFSDDVFTYIFSGRILAVYGADPLNTAPFQFPNDPYLHWVISGRGAPNIYGPLWLCIASLLVRVHASPATMLTLFKGVALLAHLVNCLLVWAILGRIAPQRRMLGTLLYAWNPLALIELAGSGHNEGVLIFLLLLTTWLYVLRSERRTADAADIMNVNDQDQQGHIFVGRPRGGPRPPIHTRPVLLPIFDVKNLYGGAALLVLGLAISTNLIALLLAPLYLWFDVRDEENILRICRGLCWRAFIVLVPALAISLPFWRGASTFFAITSAIDMGHFVHSPAGILAGPMRAIFQFIARIGHFPKFVPPDTAADVTLRATATVIFVLIYTRLFAQVRLASTQRAGTYHNASTVRLPEIDALLGSCGIAVYWYMVLVSGWFWPWYLLWLLWVVVLRRFDAFTAAMLLLSGTALFIYPFVGFSRGPIAAYQTALIFGIPLAYLAIASGLQKRAERITVSHE
jgi:hypothetical protein